MRYPRLSSLFQSLRFKLTVLNSVVVLLASVVSLLAMREGLRYALQQETDQILREETAEIALEFEKLHPQRQPVFELLDSKAEVHRERGWFVQLVDPRGATIWSSEGLPDVIKAKPVDSRRRFIILAAGPYRVAERSVEPKVSSAYTVRVGTSVAFIQDDVNKLTRYMIPVGLAFVIVSPLGGFLLAGRATAPFQEIIATTERLQPSHLNDRLAIRGTGDELDQLSIKINHFLDQIASYLQRHREFVGDAAHELRSPLAAMQSSIEVGLGKTRTTQEYEDLLFEISDECRQLGVLVNQLLLLAETETGMDEARHPVPLDELVQGCCDMFEAAAEEKSVELVAQIQSPAVVLGDQSRLRQVVNNLIDNALKFTPNGGRVVVHVSSDLLSRSVVLTVADSGVGIPPEEADRIFDRFYQVDKSRERADSKRGSGLGLSICKSIVNAYGGRISVESAAGRGAKFSVILPAAESA